MIPHRLKIVNSLSNGGLCTCDLLTHFTFSQPTLSYNMKVLQLTGIVLFTVTGGYDSCSNLVLEVSIDA
ncbi:ArsR family transcriptional regulator [Lactiplantibacillus mudanjiangensis]|uniref:ArsR family transcriptional regulator n=1 Tax=Lactiplantibacillus mudanjiangensis TaxID=1296538 RepID=UPI003F67F3A8